MQCNAIPFVRACEDNFTRRGGDGPSNASLRQTRKGVNRLIILGAHGRYRSTENAGVFEGAAPNVQVALNELKHEAQLWTFAGARAAGVLDTVAKPTG
jgi:hypothetical protein